METQLETDPDNRFGHEFLLLFYSANKTIPPEQLRPLRRKHYLWMIEHQPDSLMLDSLRMLGPPLDDPASYAAAAALWRKVLAAHPPAPPKVFANAVIFFLYADLTVARELASEAFAAYPDDANVAKAKGQVLALTILGVASMNRFGMANAIDESLATSEVAAQARQELDATSSASLLGAAATTLSAPKDPVLARTHEQQTIEAAALSEHLFLRAIELDPRNQNWRSGLASVYWVSSSRKAGAARVALLEKALATAGNASPRNFVLPALAEACFAAGDLDRAAETAQLALDLGADDGNRGGAWHTGNIVLGRIAVKKGDIDEAKRRLLAAGNTTTTPSLGSFGPDWNLAQELLLAGEPETVLQYIDLCRVFWTMGARDLDAYAAAIRNEKAPHFHNVPPPATMQQIGKRAAAFQLARLSGGEASLADYKGKVLVLDFWATWCAPCLREMPVFEKLYQEFAGTEVAIVAVDVKETERIVLESIAKGKYTFPVLLAKERAIPDSYAVEALPTLIVIDKNGVIADVVVGSTVSPEARIREAIAKARR
ncbi:MAG: redoxin domain-containing protein [Candidatus Solibacter sp.]